MEEYREIVDFYKLGIEEETGVSLRGINVKQYSEFVEDLIDISQEDVFRKLKRIPDNTDRFMVNVTIAIFRPFLNLCRLISEDVTNGMYFKPNSTIYAGINPFTKLSIPENTIVHELSHGLWPRLDGKKTGLERNPELRRKKRIWEEGFTVYCAEDYFSDLYPRRYNPKCSRTGKYKKGKQLVDRLVEEYGSDIVLQVPKKWQEFDRELNGD